MSSVLSKVCLLVLSCLLMAGCAFRGGGGVQREESKLKVMFWNEDSFAQKYGDLFSMKYPDIEIEIVNTQDLYRNGLTDTVLKEFIEREQPDVLMLEADNYETYALEGNLVDLDPLIKRDKYNIDSIYPAFIELLKDKGGNKLYGLTPSFYGNVIYYNVDLFAKYGVEVPHDGMSWQEIIDLARRFPTEGDELTRVYGYGAGMQYSGMDLNNVVSMIAATQGLRPINPSTMKLTINTDSWKQAYRLAMDAVESDAGYNPKGGGSISSTLNEYYDNEPFLAGRMAMTIDGPYLMLRLKQVKDEIKVYKPFQLGIAAGPVDPAEPNKSRDIYFGDIFSIDVNSPNVDVAWEFIKFINGEEYAKIKSRTLNNGLLSRMGESKELDGVSLDAFYKLMPNLDTSYRGMDKIPSEFYSHYQPIVDREMLQVQNKQKSLDEALRSIQDEGQVVLDQVIKNKEIQ